MTLITPKEAATKLGLASESSIYHRVERGQLEFIHQEVDGKTRNFIESATLVDIKVSPRQRHQLPEPIETLAPSIEAEAEDPLDVAIVALTAAVRGIRRAIHAHDKGVRREAVTDLVESLREGLGKK